MGGEGGGKGVERLLTNRVAIRTLTAGTSFTVVRVVLHGLRVMGSELLTQVVLGIVFLN